MFRITEIRQTPTETEIDILRKCAKKLRITPEEITDYVIFKRSLDARKKDDIHYRLTVDVSLENEKPLLKYATGRDFSITPSLEYHLPNGKVSPEHRPVVVGFGPGGMFAGLLMAQMGLNPIILERGEAVEERQKTVSRFWKDGILNTESNVQFGEGGAGTFSDGKLTTRIKDPRCRKVIKEFIAAGAPPEILYDNKPHIGTDRLRSVVKHIREQIISLGGEVHFNQKVTGILQNDGKLTGVQCQDGTTYETTNAIFSIGHSARDTFQMLYEQGITMEQKPFAVGVRIEHPQTDINIAQFGKNREEFGAADYKLTYQTKNGRGVYSFCMCPGGYVIGASSEEGRISVNGMSEYKRDGENANSAILVQVFPADFEDSHPLAGITFQQKLEERAYEVGGSNYHVPVQTLGDFLAGEKTTALGEVKPTYQPGITFSSMEDIFPPFMIDALKEAFPVMGKRIKGFDRKDAILTAVESRSSSPVRLVRDQAGESVSVEGLFPVGEGAGYAGGIVSAAVDGIRAAEQIFERYRKEQ